MDVDNQILGSKCTDGFRLIAMFFKEIGLYKEFREYCSTTPAFDNFDMTLENPFHCFGQTTITSWFNQKKHIYPISTFYKAFQAWMWAFYPEFSEYYDGMYQPSESKGYSIDIQKRKITIKYEKI